MNAPVRILCVDDNSRFLETLSEYLLLHDSFEVAGTADDGKSALVQAQKLQPDVILLDLHLGEESAVHLIPNIKKQVPDAKIIIVTIMDGGDYRDIVLKAGADAFVHKSYLTKLLVPSIYRLMQITLKPLSSTSKNEYLPFSRLIENSKDLIFRYELEPKRGFTYVNPAATAFTGYTPAEHYADPDLGFKLVHPDDRALLESVTQRGVSGLQPITLRWIRKDGAAIWTEQFNVPIYNESGKLIAIEGTARDVTERKQTEDNLLETENKFKYVFDNSIVGKSITLPSGEITVNKAFCQMLGYSQGELQKKNWQEISHPEEVALSQGVVTSILSGERDSARFTKRYIRKDGAVVWAEVHTALRRDQAGKPLYFMTVVNDITARIQTEDKLRESERFGRSILDALSSHIAVLDENGTIIAVNHPWIEFSKANDGDPEKTSIGVNYLKLCDQTEGAEKKDAALIAEGIRAVIRGEREAFITEYPCHAPTEKRWFTANVTRFQQSGPLRIVIKHENITVQKESDRQIQYQAKLLENVNDAIIATDENQILTAWNAAAERTYGWKAEEVLGKSGKEIVQAQWSEAEEAQAMRRMLIETGHWRGEATHVRRDGTRFPVSSSITVLRNDIGEINGYVGLSSDITEHKQAQETRRKLYDRFQLAVRAGDLGVWDWEIENNILIWDEQMYALYGITKESFAGAYESWLNGVHPEDRPLSDQAIQNALHGNGQFDIEFRVLWPDSSIHYLRGVGDVFFDRDGRPLRMVGVNFDISERKKSDEIIRQQLRRLAILRKIDQGIAGSVDLHSVLETILKEGMSELNIDAGVLLLYHPDNQILKYEVGMGMNTDALQHTKLRLGQGYAGKAAQSGKTIFIPNLQNRNTDFLRSPSFVREGFHCYFGVPLITKGEIKGVLEMFHRVPLHPEQEWVDFMETLAGQTAIAVDNAQLWHQAQRHAQELEQRVTERTEELEKTNIELERASRIKDEFLANMSHELRTPLNSILGMTETLLEQVREPITDNQQKYLRIIDTSGRHLLELINDILDLSKIEAGKIDLFPEIIEVSMLLQSSVTFIKQMAHQKSIDIIYNSGDSASKIYADPRRLKQILVNLLMNAVKFTQEHGTITLEFHSEPEQNRVQFSVADTGIGIAPEGLQQLFQPFVQLDSALNRQQEGTGLGLALVRKLTDLHGGSVQVESEMGKGSRFTVNLPMGVETIMQHEIYQVNEKGSHNDHFTQANIFSQNVVIYGTILLVEDNLANILSTGGYLESHGCVVKVAHNGLEAIEMVEETNPDIILMDIQMPVMDGLEAIRHIRANPRFAATPIIALTALAMSGDRERCLEAGANEYISKPASLKGLLENIKKLLK